MAAVRRSSPGSPKPAGVWIPLRQRQRPGEPPIKRRPELRLRCRQCFCVALHRVADCAVEGDRVDAPPPGCRRGCLMQQVDARQAGLPRIYRSPGTRGCGSASLSVRRGAACGTPERPDSAYILGMNESGAFRVFTSTPIMTPMIVSRGRRWTSLIFALRSRAATRQKKLRAFSAGQEPSKK
jgi:hypothetical protein